MKTALYLFLFSSCLSMCMADARKQPNIIVIMSDDQGYADIGIQGCKDVKTPHMDALAMGGVRCTDAYVTAPVCSPSRAGMLSGRYQQRFGHYYNTGGPHGLPVSVTTIADRMKNLGYATAAFGKWHLGTAPQFHPNKRGFDHFYGILGGHAGYFKTKVNVNGKKVEETEYLTDALGRETVAFITKNKDKPFFIYCAFNAVHSPMHAKEEHLKMYESITNPKRKKYAGMLKSMDENIGKIIKALEDQQLLEDTLIFFLSDNGGPTPYTQADNGSLRGSKGMTWEGGVRVPYFVSWKGHLPAGKVYKGIVSSLDIYATALVAGGASIQPEWQLDGLDILPRLKNKSESSETRDVFWKWHEQWGIRHHEWKLVFMRGEKKPSLFRLDKDRSEQNDLSASHPEKFQELKKLYDDWDNKNVIPLWGTFGRPVDKDGNDIIKPKKSKGERKAKKEKTGK